MRPLWSNKLFFWNFAILALLKLAVGPVFQYASVIDGGPVFSAQEIIVQTNEYREGLGLSLLRENEVLNRAAAQKLDDMVRNQYFAHYSPAGVSPWHWFVTNEYDYGYAGENLAIGYAGAQATVDAWIQSPSHRSNIVSPAFQEIGVATAAVTINGDRGVLVVQLFGTPATAPSVAGTQSQSLFDAELSRSEAGERTVVAAVQSSRGVRLLNQSFVAYAFLLSLLALGYLWFKESRKEFALKTALHILLFMLAVSLPVIVSQAGRIQ